ncbi:DUF7502 family protein [Halomicrobium salinisoli]|uniref:DUF7502 family protein n=1 Tax=Halomicrobium salinisoli TaxID=2878391 RepID=UPI001CEFE6D5|nr:hypothetical protein [Halomicrobium salinisoli]
MTGPDDVAAAVAEVRREARKAAAVDAAVDAGLALLAVNLALSVFGLEGALPADLPAPDGAVAAGLAGVAAGAVSGVVRARRYSLAAFEAVNPELGASLRTARDAADLDRDGVMARRLYGDALDALASASSHGLLDRRRLAVRTLVVAVLAATTVHAAVVGVEVDPLADRGGPGAVDADPTGSDETATPRNEFADNDSVLGEPKTPASGDEDVAADVSSSYGSGDEGEASEYDDRGYPGGDGDVSARRAGFDEPEEVEDADLIRDYAVSLNGSDTDD